jgi:hypothetical protein
MKLLHVGLMIAAVLVASASMASAQTMVEGQVVGVNATCSGATPDTCGGILDIGTGVGSYGSVTEVYIPEGTMFTLGSAQVPITNVAPGDYVRIDYTTASAGDMNTSFNTASSVTLLGRAGAGFNIGHSEKTDRQ